MIVLYTNKVSRRVKVSHFMVVSSSHFVLIRGDIPATLMSVAKAISKPPPSAVPSRADMTGLGRSLRSWIIFRAAAVNSET